LRRCRAFRTRQGHVAENLGHGRHPAEIDWGNPQLPRGVNVKNLTTVKGIALGE
jgi:hypothetical protein